MSKTLLRHTLIKKYFWHFSWFPYLYTFSLYENASFIIVSAETEYISTISWWAMMYMCDRVSIFYYILELFSLCGIFVYFIWLCIALLCYFNITFCMFYSFRFIESQHVFQNIHSFWCRYSKTFVIYTFVLHKMVFAKVTVMWSLMY
jgi:hypothetical protein